MSDERRTPASGNSVATLAQHEALVVSLLDPQRWPQGGGERRRIDTHISTVVLAGERAYKLKKPLDLGFLDFLSLDARERACREELRLNGRLAPQIYLGVSAISGSIGSPQVDGDGPVIDWAVCMRRFDPDAILANPEVPIDARLIESLAQRVAAFHRDAAVCAPSEPYGDPAVALQPMQQNFVQIRAAAAAGTGQLDTLETWTQQRFERLEPVLRSRKADGRVRECHGDLHLGNVALIAGEPVVFDAIEFNAGLRWIDTANDIAFLTMDLHHRALPALAFRFLDTYLHESGDYAALGVLQFYEVYRALVRAKIAAIRLQQELTPLERESANGELVSYLDLAARLTAPARGGLVITHGASGSGKSHVTAGLPGDLRAVRLRSDVERKRLLGIDPHSDATDIGGYSSEVTERTYGRLADLACTVIAAGYVAIVDATFLRAAQRARFRALAADLRVPFVIIDCDSPRTLLRDRIQRRRTAAGNVSDADLAVLDAQLATAVPLDEAEKAHSLTVGPEHPLPVERLRALLAG